MNTSNILFSIDGRVATIKLNRPAQLNALSTSMLSCIDAALRDVESCEACVLVFSSTITNFFCSGADIVEWGDIDPEGMGSRFVRSGNRVFRRIAELDIPTIAKLSGSAFGGGLELALSCDLRYAATDAVFGFPEVSLGAVPGWMGCERLLSLVGRARSRELILLGEPITAARALDWGIVNEIAPTHRLDERVAQVCELIERRSSTSLSVSKRLLRSVESGQPELSHEFAASVCKASIDAQEGVRAFKEKRPAKFR